MHYVGWESEYFKLYCKFSQHSDELRCKWFSFGDAHHLALVHPQVPNEVKIKYTLIQIHSNPKIQIRHFINIENGELEKACASMPSPNPSPCRLPGSTTNNLQRSSSHGRTGGNGKADLAW